MKIEFIKSDTWIDLDPWEQVIRIRRSGFRQVFPRVNLQVPADPRYSCPALHLDDTSFCHCKGPIFAQPGTSLLYTSLSTAESLLENSTPNYCAAFVPQPSRFPIPPNFNILQLLIRGLFPIWTRFARAGPTALLLDATNSTATENWMSFEMRPPLLRACILCRDALPRHWSFSRRWGVTRECLVSPVELIWG